MKLSRTDQVRSTYVLFETFSLPSFYIFATFFIRFEPKRREQEKMARKHIEETSQDFAIDCTEPWQKIYHGIASRKYQRQKYMYISGKKADRRNQLIGSESECIVLYDRNEELLLLWIEIEHDGCVTFPTELLKGWGSNMNADLRKKNKGGLMERSVSDRYFHRCRYAEIVEIYFSYRAEDVWHRGMWCRTLYTYIHNCRE